MTNQDQLNMLELSDTSAQAVYRVLSTVTSENIDKAQLDDEERSALMSTYDRLMLLNMNIDIKQTFRQVGIKRND